MRRVSHGPIVDSRGNELVERQLPAGEDMRTEAENIVGIHYQAMTNEGVED
jgi:hypothetical protein